MIFIGSSKGASSALYYSFQIENAIPVVGAPQYFLGQYLLQTSNRATLESMVGEITDDSVKKADGMIAAAIANSGVRPKKVYLHYSDLEHTYDDHIKYLIADLERAGVELVKDVRDYPNHNDLVYFFPDYLKQTIDELCIQYSES